ncbi:MAG: hypothetical protein JNJ71_13380 [Rubrivivax sp.]|nr:hypothetical protein [Rubrivivax sp.]
MVSRSGSLFSHDFSPALEGVAALFDTAMLQPPPSATHAGGIGPAGQAEPGVLAQALPLAGEPTAARAWRLQMPDAQGQADPELATLIFVEAATPSVAAPSHGVWLSWQKSALRAGHACYSLVVPRLAGAAAASDICERLQHCLQTADAKGSAVLVLRFDAAALVHLCGTRWLGQVQQVIVGPTPLWPLPSAGLGQHPLRSLYNVLGWMDQGMLGSASAAAWQLLDHPFSAMAWPGLVQAALWQESVARGALTGGATGQAWARSLGPWLVPGMASVLADDWAVRRAAPESQPLAAQDSLPLRVVFSAEDTEPARIWASDYARDLFSAVCAEPRVELAAGPSLPLDQRLRRAGTRNLQLVPVAADPQTPPAAPAPVEAPAAAPRARARPAPRAAQGAQGAKGAKGARGAGGARADADVRPDDLQRIEGIGPKIEAILQAAGIRSYQDLASAEPERLQALLQQAGPRFALARPGTWPRQSALLAAGDEAGFAQLTAELKGGVEA